MSEYFTPTVFGSEDSHSGPTLAYVKIKIFLNLKYKLKHRAEI